MEPSPCPPLIGSWTRYIKADARDGRTVHEVYLFIPGNHSIQRGYAHYNVSAMATPYAVKEVEYFVHLFLTKTKMNRAATRYLFSDQCTDAKICSLEK